MTHLGLVGRETTPDGTSTAWLERILAGPVLRDVPVPIVEPADERDALITLLGIHDLWMAPLDRLGGREVHQSNPDVVRLKASLEGWFVERLDGRCPEAGLAPGEAVSALRTIAATNLVPATYGWLADDATWEQLVHYLALEGGPDGGFDDLVALAQIGIEGDPKVALAANYWDEMGRGDLAAVHTELHRRLVDALEMPAVSRREVPVSALERSALNGLLATNRHLQPEMIGALGLLEMQAGPRCRAVLKALRRLDAPRDSFPFYEEHAQADPRHGKDWLDRVVGPLASDPDWGARMLRGAHWRADINARFFRDAQRLCQEAFPAPSEAKIA